jgi:hypothetical protein
MVIIELRGTSSREDCEAQDTALRRTDEECIINSTVPEAGKLRDGLL